MLPETHPLIAAATKPLADNAEQQLAANAMLEENFDPESPAILTTLTRLEESGEKRRPANWKIVLWLVTLTCLSLAIYSHTPEIRLAVSMYNWSLFEPPELAPLPSGLSEHERLLLGNPELEPVEQKRLLHLHAPDNPAYFAEYAGAYASENESLPPGYFETVARIAPENSYFLYFAAAETGKRSYEKVRTSLTSSKPRIIDGVKLGPAFREQEYTITDQAAFYEAMALIRQAAKLPDFQTYTGTMMAEQSDILPSGTLAEFMHSLFCSYSPVGSFISLRCVADLMDARAEELSKAGGKEEFLDLARQREAFMSALADNGDVTLVGELIYTVIGSATAVGFHASAERLGLAEQAETYRLQKDAFQAMKDSRSIRAKTDPEPFPAEHSSNLAGSSLLMLHQQTSPAPPINKTDLKPLRMAEHEAATRLWMTSAALILLLACLPVYLFRFVFPRIIRIPAKKFTVLLRPIDWVWVVLPGIVFPLIIHLTISRLTPLGGREYGINHFLYLFPGIHLLAIAMNLLLAPALLLRWRLSKRLSPFGTGAKGGRISGLVLLAILIWSLAALPVLVRFGQGERILIGLCFVPMLWVTNVFLNAVHCILGKAQKRLIRATASAALPTAYAIGIIVLCATLPVFIASEKHWVAKDTLYHINPNAENLGAYEFRVAALKRKEINTILGFE